MLPLPIFVHYFFCCDTYLKGKLAFVYTFFLSKLFFLDVRLESDDLQSQSGSVKTRWVRKDFDADGYFLLQLVKSKKMEEKYMFRDMFLTSDNPSSLTIQGTYLHCTVVYM